MAGFSFLFRSGLQFTCVSLAALFIFNFHALARDQTKLPADAFEEFIVNNDIQNAHFFLQNGILTPDDIDTSKVFLKALLRNNISANNKAPLRFQNIGQVGRLIEYLNSIKPIDLNISEACRDYGGSDDRQKCGLATVMLAQGVQPDVFGFYLQHGLSLGARPADVPSPALALIANLGNQYSMEDLNWFVQNGLELGLETFSLSQFSQLQEFYHLDLNRSYKIPEARLDTYPFNFLDALTMTLTSGRYSSEERSRHQDFLCRYILFVAGQMAPTFDHFSFLMNNVEEFRGANIGKTEKARNGKSGIFYYEVFPKSCKAMISAMALSSAKLDETITQFAANSDILTAQWLVSIKQGGLQSNVQNN